MIHRIIHSDGWKPAKGHANGMPGADGTLHVGGQIGWTGDQVFVARDFIGQMEQALRNILTVVTAAGGRAEDYPAPDVVRGGQEDLPSASVRGRRDHCKVPGRHFPAMTMVVIQDEALLEIEATAFVGRPDRSSIG